MHRKQGLMFKTLGQSDKVMNRLAGYTKEQHEEASGMGLEDTFMSHHVQPCDCAVCDDIAFRRSLRSKSIMQPAGMELLRLELQAKHGANCLLRLLLETLPIKLEQERLTHDKTACAMLIQDQIDYLFRDGEDILIGSPSNDEQQAMKLAYQMGRDSLKHEIEDWLNSGFDYENSVMTVHKVREVLQRYTQVRA